MEGRKELSERGSKDGNKEKKGSEKINKLVRKELIYINKYKSVICSCITVTNQNSEQHSALKD